MLKQILADAEARAETARSRATEFRSEAASAPEARSFGDAVSGGKLIAEIKRRSPSRGVLAPGLDAAAQAKRYEAAGAAAVSVLTESAHFDGSLDDLMTVRSAIDLPVLRKDFLLDPAQIWESRAAGADAVLLIVSILGEQGLATMLPEAAAAGVDALVEVHDTTEAELALGAGARIVGVNNRDLVSFTTDLAVAESVAPMIRRPGVVTVAESGVSDPEGAARMWAAGYDAILVGEALVTAADPEALLQTLVVS
ncbi:MAG: indole-3-glycerol phosphate synthase TrpC [Acidimicrobiia bacterium]|nr:MAG: indole-3-glycerol phosphate synthase TrpC [Acidimicrobiia bacterium]